ncbi:MAG TPA: hypothetical protein VMJ66_08695, partial [Geobacteraceae bacterium]|nr:hypothetical protein [Geobacteraceae bacterium]
AAACGSGWSRRTGRKCSGRTCCTWFACCNNAARCSCRACITRSSSCDYATGRPGHSRSSGSARLTGRACARSVQRTGHARYTCTAGAPGSTGQAGNDSSPGGCY